MRENWTDERLDDMNGRISDGFGRLDDEIRGLRSDVRAEFAAVRAEMSSRFEATQRLILQVGAGMFGTMVVGFIGLVLSQH
jgi:hypothetical protein